MKTPQPKDWQEELRQSVLTTLNLFAMAIEADGYTPELHGIYTNRILEDTQDAVEAERARLESLIPEKKDKTECKCPCHESGKKCCYECIETHYPIKN